ncbi:tyrosine-type recombinase/integrase [Streptococcus suis]|nr:tyrosine-type recombinase/integrase [Streptococcus suis]
MKIREYKTKKGEISYRGTVYLGIDVITGESVTTSVSAKTKRELKQRERDKIREWQRAGQTKFRYGNVKTFSELVDIWRTTHYSSLKFNSKRIYDFQIEKYILPAFGKILLSKISRASIQKVVNQWATNYNNGKPNSYKEYRNMYSLTKNILSFGVSLGLLQNNPAYDVIIPKIKYEQPKRKHFEPPEVKKLLHFLEGLDSNNFTNLTDKTLFMLLLSTGLRIGECLALEWQDIDFIEKTVSISKTLQRNYQTTATKTKSGNRTISIDNKTVKMLSSYKKRQQLNGISTGIVFSRQNNYLNINALSYRLKKYLKVLDLPLLRFHAFRHTHASLMINAGMQPKELQYRLGHSDISMTLNIYSHLSKEKEKESATIFEKALNSL